MYLENVSVDAFSFCTLDLADLVNILPKYASSRVYFSQYEFDVDFCRSLAEPENFARASPGYELAIEYDETVAGKTVCKHRISMNMAPK